MTEDDKMKCAYCGKALTPRPPARRGAPPLAPTHDYPPPCRSVCPGTGTPMLALDDAHTALGKDEP